MKSTRSLNINVFATSPGLYCNRWSTQKQISYGSFYHVICPSAKDQPAENQRGLKCTWCKKRPEAIGPCQKPPPCPKRNDAPIVVTPETSDETLRKENDAKRITHMSSNAFKRYFLGSSNFIRTFGVKQRMVGRVSEMRYERHSKA